MMINQQNVGYHICKQANRNERTLEVLQPKFHPRSVARKMVCMENVQQNQAGNGRFVIRSPVYIWLNSSPKSMKWDGLWDISGWKKNWIMTLYWAENVWAKGIWGWFCLIVTIIPVTSQWDHCKSSRSTNIFPLRRHETIHFPSLPLICLEWCGTLTSSLSHSISPSMVWTQWRLNNSLLRLLTVEI